MNKKLVKIVQILPAIGTCWWCGHLVEKEFVRARSLEIAFSIKIMFRSVAGDFLDF